MIIRAAIAACSVLVLASFSAASPLNGAADVRFGDIAASAVYAGSELVWSAVQVFPVGFRLIRDAGPTGSSGLVPAQTMIPELPNALIDMQVMARKAGGVTPATAQTALGIWVIGSVPTAGTASPTNNINYQRRGISGSNSAGYGLGMYFRRNAHRASALVSAGAFWTSGEWHSLEINGEAGLVDGSSTGIVWSSVSTVTQPLNAFVIGYGAYTDDMRYQHVRFTLHETGETLIDVRYDGNGGLIDIISGTPLNLPKGIRAEPLGE